MVGLVERAAADALALASDALGFGRAEALLPRARAAERGEPISRVLFPRVTGQTPAPRADALAAAADRRARELEVVARRTRREAEARRVEREREDRGDEESTPTSGFETESL